MGVKPNLTTRARKGTDCPSNASCWAIDQAIANYAGPHLPRALACQLCPLSPASERAIRAAFDEPAMRVIGRRIERAGEIKD